MGPLKSEYGRRYQDPLWQIYVEHYLENVEYCNQRRQLEHSHQSFDWQCTDSDTDSDDDASLEAKHGMPVKHATKTNETHNQSVPGHMNKETQGEAEKFEKVPPNAIESGVKNPRSKNKKSRKLKKIHCEPIPSGRKPTKSPTAQIKSTKLPLQKEPRNAPFIVYGWADDRRAVGMKQTHNVKASLSDRSSVYPGALNAQMRKLLNEEEEARKRQKRVKNKAVKLQPYMNMVAPSDHWQTEYQRNYSR